jgi:phosphohistidine phosphatase
MGVYQRSAKKIRCFWHNKQGRIKKRRIDTRDKRGGAPNVEILLMRHGKAEPPQRTDYDRELTAAGRQRIRSASLGLKQMVGSKPLIIWTSHLPRARQTADIIAETLNVTAISEHEAIYSGDLDSLIPGITGLPEDSMLLIIGHEPCLSGWSERISGVLIPFKPAAVACFKISHRQPLIGKLRWFALPKVLADWGIGDSNVREGENACQITSKLNSN